MDPSANSWSDAELLYFLERDLCYAYMNQVAVRDDYDKVRSIHLYNNIPVAEYMRRNSYEQPYYVAHKKGPQYGLNAAALYRILDGFGRPYLYDVTANPGELHVRFVSVPTGRGKMIETLLQTRPVAVKMLTMG